MTTKPESSNDYKKLARFLSEIEKCEKELDTLKGQHMERCQNVRKRKSAWFDQISDAGFDLATIKFNLKEDKLEAALESHRNSAEADTVEDAEAIRAKLKEFAGTPLGAAAVEAAAEADAVEKAKVVALPRSRKARPDMSAKSKEAALNPSDESEDLRPTALKKREAERRAEAEKNLGGMKMLPVEEQPPVAH